MSLDIAVEPLHLLPSEFVISVGFTRPFLQACAPFIAGACVGVGVLFKCFLLKNQYQQHHHHHHHNSRYSLPTFALLNHTFNTIHSTIRTCDLSIRSNVISLHDIASHFPGATRRASFRGPPLDRLWISIGVKICCRLRPFLGPRICGRCWRLGAIRVVGPVEVLLGTTHDDGGGFFLRGELQHVMKIGSGGPDDNEKEKL